MEQVRNRPLDGGPYRLMQADALRVKVREGGRIVIVHGLIAVGSTPMGTGKSSVFQVSSAEDGAG